MLHERGVKNRRDHPGDTLIPHVLHHPDDDHRMFCVGTHLKLSSNGICVGPEFLCHCLTHDRYVLSIFTVGIGERAAT